MRRIFHSLERARLFEAGGPITVADEVSSSDAARRLPSSTCCTDPSRKVSLESRSKKAHAMHGPGLHNRNGARNMHFCKLRFEEAPRSTGQLS